MKRILLLIITLPFIVGPAPTGGCAWKRSSFFNGLDKNADDRLSYHEWMASYSRPEHSHNLDKCSRSDFYVADCDVDDYLTWNEYHDFRFRHKVCESPAVMTVRQMYELNSAQQIKPSRADVENIISLQHEALIKRERELKEKYGLVNK